MIGNTMHLRTTTTWHIALQAIHPIAITTRMTITVMRLEFTGLMQGRIIDAVRKDVRTTIDGAGTVRLTLSNQTLIRLNLGLCVFERFSSIRFFFKLRQAFTNCRPYSNSSGPYHSTTTTLNHFRTSAVATHGIKVSPSHD